MNRVPAISVKNLTKSFSYWANRPYDLKAFLISFLRGQFFKKATVQSVLLENISFDINAGEFVGIMGENGAGKSTLLRLISGIYAPNIGTIEVNGNISPLIALGAGFSPELTGLENIFLSASILGYGRARALESVDKIIEFSGLGEHIDKAVKDYSSGMVVRLGFSIAVFLEAPILLLDEILGVGDAGFAQKSLNKIREMHLQGRTIVLVNHSPETIETHCTRCIVIADKKIAFDGSAKQGAEFYRKLFIDPPA